MNLPNTREEDEQFSGNELDEPKGEESIPVREKEPQKTAGKKYRWGKKLSLFTALGLCLLTGIGYLYLKGGKPTCQETEAPQINRATNPEDQLLILHSFVVPFEENSRFTYISLSISFDLPNKELRREISEKKYQFRNIIFQTLREEINRKKEVPSLERLKEVIVEKINMALAAGRIKELYITQFLAV